MRSTQLVATWVVVSLVVGSSVAEAQSVRQATASSIDELVDVGGYRLRVRCAGEGSPTVLLEAGLGSNSATWDSVAPAVVEFTRVCRYDRPNLGRSDPSPRELRQIGSTTFIALRSGQEVVTDLRRLLTAVGGEGQYVVVGHSLGGLFVILFASLYPDDVAGVVLVDSAHPDQVARSHALMTLEEANVIRTDSCRIGKVSISIASWTKCVAKTGRRSLRSSC